jgi:hypothetical protein
MANKFFNYQGAPWQIIETQDPWGKPLTIAVEMDSTDAAMLNTEEEAQDSDWEYVEASAVRIDEWFLRSDPNDLFIGDDEYNDNLLEDQQRYVDMMSDVHSRSVQSSKLKEMLEGLKNPPFDESNRTVGEAEDILGMIRARQERTIEMPHTVVLNESKYNDPMSLEKAIREMKKRHGDNAHIRIGKHDAEDLLASMWNKERIGLSSIMDPIPGISIDFDAETLELIKKMKLKK